MQFFFSLFRILDFMEQFEVDLIGKQVVFGSALIVFKQWIVFTIALLLHIPLRLLFHVFILRMEQFFQAFVLKLLQLCIKVLSAELYPIQPFFSLSLCSLNIVDFSIVVTFNSVLKVSSETGFRVLIFPQIAQLL
jgi:hypothetical protein